MSLLAQEKGMISFKAMFWLTLLFVVIHVLIKVVPMWNHYTQMQDAMQGKVRLAQASSSDADIKVSLEKTAGEMDLPLTQDNFIIERDPNSNKITGIRTNGGWDVEVSFLWGAYVRTFHFEPVTE
jgi:hypothetical protein